MKKHRGKFIPPPNYHDLETGLEDYIHFLELDLADMIAENDLGPHMQITKTKTRLPQGLQVLTGSGLGEGGRAHVPTLDRDDIPPYNLHEAVELGKNQYLPHDWLDTLNLNLHGNRVYHFTDAVVQWMLNTRLNIPCEEMFFPFPSLMVTTRSETLVRVFLGPNRQDEYRSGMSLALVVSHKHDPDENEAYVTITTNVVVNRKRLEWARAHIHLPYGETVGRAVKIYTQKAINTTKLPPEKEAFFNAWFDDNAETYYRTIINCLSYITTPNPAVSNPYEPWGTKAGDGTRNKCITQDVGRGLDPIEIKPSDIFKVINKGVRGSGSKLAWRVLVAGHWRAFPGEAVLGPQARRNWIKPFWRGRDDAPVRNKPYRVDKENDQ